MINFVILNGPPYSGKSTIARELSWYLNSKRVSNASDSFAAPMKHFIATALGQQYHAMAKDSPRAELAGYSVREFLIDLSESYIKPRYGEGVYGRWLYHRVGRIMPGPSFVICDDSGFEDEMSALGRNVILVRVERPNHDFSSDSRNYLIGPKYVFKNDGSLDNLWIETRKLGDWLIKGEWQ